MGIRDNELILSDAQAITVDGWSTNYINKGAAGGLGKKAQLVVRVSTAFDTAEEDGTLTIELRTAGAVTGGHVDTGDADYDVLLRSKDFTEAELVAGKELLRVDLPANVQKYFQTYHEVGAHAFTAGKLEAFIAVNDSEVRP